MKLSKSCQCRIDNIRNVPRVGGVLLRWLNGGPELPVQFRALRAGGDKFGLVLERFPGLALDVGKHRLFFRDGLAQLGFVIGEPRYFVFQPGDDPGTSFQQLQ